MLNQELKASKYLRADTIYHQCQPSKSGFCVFNRKIQSQTLLLCRTRRDFVPLEKEGGGGAGINSSLVIVKREEGDGP